MRSKTPMIGEIIISAVDHQDRGASLRLDRAAEDPRAARNIAFFWPSAFKTSASGCSPIGLLITIPTAPSGPSSTIKTTVRSKSGSPIQGAATSNWPASE